MGLTYFFAGLAKLNSDWLAGHPMGSFLAGENSFPYISPLFNEHWVALLLSWAGAGFDLLIVPLLLWHRTRILALTAAISFPLINSLIFDIEVFPWFAITATLLFLSPGCLERSVCGITIPFPTSDRRRYRTIGISCDRHRKPAA